MSKKTTIITLVILVVWLAVLSFFLWRNFSPVALEDGVTIVNNYIDGFSNDLSEAYDEVKEHVVTIKTDNSLASGFIARSSEDTSYIVTNYHVIEKATNIQVELDNYVTYQASVVGYDEVSDVAILAISNEYELSGITWGDEKLLKSGNFVIAVGCPHDDEYRASLALGLVSNYRRMIEVNVAGKNHYLGMIQSDVDLSEGYSGGPLINMAGELVGLNTLREDDEAHISLALGVNELRYIVEDILRDGSVSRIDLGIKAYPMKEFTTAQKTSLGFDLDEVSGIYVEDVLSSSIAESMGLQAGDVLLASGSFDFRDYGDYLEFIYTSQQEFSLSILRDGERVSLSYPL